MPRRRHENLETLKWWDGGGSGTSGSCHLDVLGRKCPAKIETGTESQQTPIQEVADISLLDTQVFWGDPFFGTVRSLEMSWKVRINGDQINGLVITYL